MKTILTKFVNHQLTSVFFGFFLTGILGFFLSNNYLEEQKENEKHFFIASENRKAINDISRMIYERRVRASLLHSSFRRNASLEEIIDRKRLYDSAFVKWGTNIQANLLITRNILKSSHYTFFEKYMETGLVPILTDIDTCLTQAYDQRLSGNKPNKHLEACNLSEKLKLALDYGYALTEGLFIIAGAMDFHKEDKNDSNFVESQIISNCGNA